MGIIPFRQCQGKPQELFPGRKLSRRDDFGIDLGMLLGVRVHLLHSRIKIFFHPCKLFGIGWMNATQEYVFRSFSWKDLVGIGYLIYLCNRKRGNDLLQRMSHPSEGG